MKTPRVAHGQVSCCGAVLTLAQGPSPSHTAWPVKRRGAHTQLGQLTQTGQKDTQIRGHHAQCMNWRELAQMERKTAVQRRYVN